MTGDEFRAWLETMVESERINREQASDVAQQREIFDELRATLVEEYLFRDVRTGEDSDRGPASGIVVGYQHGERLTANTISDLLEQARRRSNYWLVYFEPLGFNPFGSVYGATGQG